MADQIDIANELADEWTHAQITRRIRYSGESSSECDECGDAIPEARRHAVPGVRLCVECQEEVER